MRPRRSVRFGELTIRPLRRVASMTPGSAAFWPALKAERIAGSFPPQTHMGRVNSARRLLFAMAFGCKSVDGTAFSRHAEVHLPWALRVARQIPMGLHVGPREASA